MITELTPHDIVCQNGTVRLMLKVGTGLTNERLVEVDLTQVGHGVRLKLPTHMSSPCPTCDSMRWHPYPEEKPTYDTYYFVQVKRFGMPVREVMRLSKGEFRDYDGAINSLVEAWAEIKYPNPYTPPPKKKTVRVKPSAIIEAMVKNPLAFTHDNQPANFIEIEADE